MIEQHGDNGALAAAAEGDDRFGAVELVESVRQFAQENMGGTCQPSLFVFVDLTHIQQDEILVFLESLVKICGVYGAYPVIVVSRHFPAVHAPLR